MAPGQGRGVPAGHQWVFAGEISEVAGDPVSGAIVDLYTESNRVIGRGFYNPHSKIRVRILTVHDEPINEEFWRRRLDAAIRFRARVVGTSTAYRLVHGESDWLPGLIVDRYADVLVMQTLSVGMDQRKELLADLLLDLTGARAVYLRNDVKSRVQEGLPQELGFVRGEGATRVEVMEHGARFLVDVARGQKTGWFCDQRENRLAAASLARGLDVLEVFAHTGAFGTHAALQGAASVTGVDVSEDAVALAQEHAVLNKVQAQCTYRVGDAFDALRTLDRTGQRYDLVILDPPAFARAKTAVPKALAGYKEVNVQALRLLRPEGFLVTCSCSHYVMEEAFLGMLQAAARDTHRQVRWLEQRTQARDHPILAAMPETRYLKCAILQVF